MQTQASPVQVIAGHPTPTSAGYPLAAEGLNPISPPDSQTLKSPTTHSQRVPQRLEIHSQQPWLRMCMSQIWIFHKPPGDPAPVNILGQGVRGGAYVGAEGRYSHTAPRSSRACWPGTPSSVCKHSEQGSPGGRMRPLACFCE